MTQQCLVRMISLDARAWDGREPKGIAKRKPSGPPLQGKGI